MNQNHSELGAGTTFGEREMNLEQACVRHAMVRKAVNEALNASGDDRTLTQEESEQMAELSGAMEEAWRALVGTLPDDYQGIVGEAVTWTMPREYAPLMRRSDSLPAAYAFVAILEELLRVDRADDLAVRDAARRAWDAFEQRRLQANCVEEGFGCDDSASWHTLRDVIDVQDEELTRKMLKIAQLAGRMFQSMSYTKRRVESDDPQEVRSATTGGDVDRLLPAELAKLGNGATKDVTAMKVLQKQAQIFQMRGERTKTRGPLVLALDESGSMHDHGGEMGRNTWAKAAAVALTRVAWSEGRAVRVVHFGDGTVVQEVPRDDMDALWEMARSFLSGGTSYDDALGVSRMEVGDLAKAGYVGADIVLITDGEEHSHDEHNRQINQMDRDGIRLWTVSIGGEIAEDAPVRKRAELYVHAHDVELPDAKLAAELAAQLKGAALAKTDNRSLN